MEVKSKFDSFAQDIDNEDLKKIEAAIRNTHAKTNKDIEGIYKAYMQKKRTFKHKATEIEEATPNIQLIKSVCQKIFIGDITTFSNYFFKIAEASFEIQQKAYNISSSFLCFLFKKLLEFIQLKLKEQNLTVYSAVTNFTEEYVALIKTFAKLIDSVGEAWVKINKESEAKSGKFNAQENLLLKRIENTKVSLEDLLKINQTLKKATKENHSSKSSLKSIEVVEKDKKVQAFIKLHSSVSFDIYDWNNRLQWQEVMRKFKELIDDLNKPKNNTALKKSNSISEVRPDSGSKIKEIKELRPDSGSKIREIKELGSLQLSRPKTPAMMKHIEEIKEMKEPTKPEAKIMVKPLRRLQKPVMSQTSSGFFKKEETNRPKSSYKTNQEDSEFLRNTFHPDVQWKII
jgi:hypothetical protein